MNSHGISVVPPFGARRYLHKFVKLLDVNITTFPLQEQMQDLLTVKIRTYKNNKFRERERCIPPYSCHGKLQDLDGVRTQHHGYPSPCRFCHILYSYKSLAHLDQLFSWAVEPSISQRVPYLYHSQQLVFVAWAVILKIH